MSVSAQGNDIIVRRSKSKTCEENNNTQVIFITRSIINSKEVKLKRAQIKIKMRGCESKSQNAMTYKEK